MQKSNRVSYRPVREKAKKKILKAVNKRRPADQQLHRCHIQRAVRIARFNGLVSDKVLVNAGYNPVGERGN